MSSAMTERFADNFWSKDFNGTDGYDRLVKRMKDGRTATKEFESFLKDRAKIEEDYHKNLVKLARTQYPSLEDGILGEMFISIKAGLEKAAEAHHALAVNLMAIAEAMRTLKDTQQVTCKEKEQLMKKLHDSKKQLHSDTLLAKQNYEKKFQQHTNAEEAFLRSKSDVTQSKDTDKLAAKKDKASLELQRADSVYSQSVKDLDRHCFTWEAELVKSCNVFQDIDEERIIILQRNFWIYMNMDAQALLDHDVAFDRARAFMETSYPKCDVVNFISNNRTCSDKPAHLVYESCTRSSPGGSPGRSRVKLGFPPIGSANSKSMFYPQPAAKPDPVYSTLDPTYSTIDDAMMS